MIILPYLVVCLIVCLLVWLMARLLVRLLLHFLTVDLLSHGHVDVETFHVGCGRGRAKRGPKTTYPREARVVDSSQNT